jgi:protein involved in sex pheromone biosynthesis
MKILIITTALLVLSACATTNTSNASNSSSKKDPVVKSKEEYKGVPDTKYPNSADTSGTAPSPYKTGDSRGY